MKVWTFQKDAATPCPVELEVEEKAKTYKVVSVKEGMFYAYITTFISKEDCYATYEECLEAVNRIYALKIERLVQEIYHLRKVKEAVNENR